MGIKDEEKVEVEKLGHVSHRKSMHTQKRAI